MTTITYCCTYCNKKYVRKFAFNNHLAKCKLNKNITLVLSTNNDYKMQYNKNISNETIFSMLLDLTSKYDKLQDDYNELKKHINVVKNKISILDYLNTNYQNLTLDFMEFTKLISIGLEEIDIIFKKDYVEGILEIINNNIDNIDNITDKTGTKNNTNSLPIRAFNQKDNCLYIYLKKYNSWKLMKADEFCNYVHYFNKNILNIFGRWNENAKLNMKHEDYSDLYVVNMKKVIGGNFEKKNINNLLKNKLYKHLKVDLKKVVTYEFI